MIADRVKKIPPSGIREFFDLVLGMPDVVSLGVGEPDFISPWRVREKAITALEEGYTSYTSNQGLLVLRQQISDHLLKKYKVSYNPKDQILITVGVSEGIDLALRAILNPHDKVIVVSPHYVAYPALAEINYGRVIPLITSQQEGFKINPGVLSKLLKRKPKAIILNYPCNPTGVTYSGHELKEIWKVLSKKDIFVISDETYDELTYSGRHVCFASLDREARRKTILLNGFSKGYAMTGFRVGYACAEKEIIQAMTKIHSYAMLCGPIISQIAACEGLRAQKEVAKMRLAYKQRRDFFVKELNRLKLATINPQGAFYCFSSVSAFGINALEFAKRLLFEEKVAVVPGGAFGREFSSYIRTSYATGLNELKEAVIRIERFLNNI